MKFNNHILQNNHKDQLLKYCFICFIVIFGYFLFYWGCLRTEPLADDLNYTLFRIDKNLFISRFILWSQRIIIEIPLFMALKAPYILNIIFCVLLYPLYTLTLCKLLKLSIRKAFLIVLPLTAFQTLSENETVGVVTTHFNYLLPLVTAMWSVIILRCDKLGFFKGILLLVFAIFSTSNEMLAVAFICMLPFLYFYDRKHKNWYIAVIAIAIIHLSMLFLSGASSIRVCTANSAIYPDFDKLHIIYKLYQGTVATIFYYFTNLNFYTLFFVFSLCCCFFKNKNHALKTSLAITIILGLVLYIYSFINYTHSFRISYFITSSLIEVTTNKACAFMCVSVVAIGILLYMLINLRCHYQIKVIVLFLLITAFAIRMILAFSPTIFYSGTRTFFISNLLILLASCYLLIRFKLFDNFKVKLVILVLGVVSVCLQASTLTPRISPPINHVTSYPYLFTKCVIKHNINAIKYANTYITNNNKILSSILTSITPEMAYTSLLEREILKSGNFSLLKNSFYNFNKYEDDVPWISKEEIHWKYLNNKDMLRF